MQEPIAIVVSVNRRTLCSVRNCASHTHPIWLTIAQRRLFLRAEAIGKSIAEAAAATVETRLTELRRDDRTPRTEIVVHPLFNTTEGYRDSVFPPVANMILQQTLLFAAARLVAKRRRRRR